MQKFAVVYFPNINLDSINSFREKYDPGFKIIPPHVTIVFPISSISENELIYHVETVTQNINSFPIHFSGLTKSFDNYLFLSVKEGNKAIINLHEKLYSGILKHYLEKEIPFNPHITLGFFGDKDSTFYADAYTRAEKAKFDFSCIFDTVSIIKGDGLSPARIIKTIKLQN